MVISFAKLLNLYLNFIEIFYRNYLNTLLSTTAETSDKLGMIEPHHNFYPHSLSI
jgi:hypothetical protein